MFLAFVALKHHLRMLGEFEDAEDSQNTDEREAAGALSTLTVAVGRVLNGQYDEVWEYRQHVDDVHRVDAELVLRRTRYEPHHELTGKPRHARLHSVIQVWLKTKYCPRAKKVVNLYSASSRARVRL